MNRTHPFRTVRRLASTLAALAATLLATAAPVQAVVAGGMPGWQIALIAMAAAILAGARRGYRAAGQPGLGCG